jgi:hypothetical protein
VNTLYHTSFDEGFAEHEGESYLLVPAGWHPIWKPGDKPGPVRPEIQPEIRSRGDKGIRTGEHGLKLAHAWAWFDAALYMQFAASSGLRYAISAYATAESDDGLACQVGIDPTGGIEPESETVHWSNWYGTDDKDFKPYTWKQILVEAEAAGDQVTVFLRCACREPVQVNADFFDDVTFSGEPYEPPPTGDLLDLIDDLDAGVTALRQHVQSNKRECLLV